MVRTPYVDKDGIRKGEWSEEEDHKLKAYILRYGHWNWRLLPKFAGLARCGKSCRLRWMNYLKPGLKRGNFSHEEEELIIRSHNELGNKWSTIAARLPGRTDNEIKNYWHTHTKKAMKQNSEATDQLPIAQTNETNQSRADQHPRNSVAFPASPDNPATESPSLCSISPHLGSTELVTEDSITSLESFGQHFDNFWTEPFYADDILYSERDNLGELCEEFTWRI